MKLIAHHKRFLKLKLDNFSNLDTYIGFFKVVIQVIIYQVFDTCTLLQDVLKYCTVHRTVQYISTPWSKNSLKRIMLLLTLFVLICCTTAEEECANIENLVNDYLYYYLKETDVRIKLPSGMWVSYPLDRCLTEAVDTGKLEVGRFWIFLVNFRCNTYIKKRQ